MKVKIIKPYELRPGREWPIGQRAEVTNELGKQLISAGYAHEIKIETRKNEKGYEYQVEVEVFDKSAQVVTLVADDHQQPTPKKKQKTN